MPNPILLTGDRPTGPLHLGHYVGSLKSRIELQDHYTSYIMIADTQALTDNFHCPQKVHEHVYEVLKDYLAVGIDPEKAALFVQSQVPELSELTSYFMNLVTVNQVGRNPTVKTEIQQKGYEDSPPLGFFCYPVSQAADIAAFKATIVPVGEDQVPMIELCNDIVKRFNRLYQEECLCEATAYLSKTGRLVGIDGQQKASKSLNNAIFLGDSPQAIRDKVQAMFTDPNHLRVSDPGTVEGNVVFAYLDAFHPNPQEVEDLKAYYRRGGLGDTPLKEMLDRVLQDLLAPIREKRQALQQPHLQEVLQEGTQRARAKAQETLQAVRAAMKLCYF